MVLRVVLRDDLAVPQRPRWALQFGAHLGGHRVVDQVVEKGEKLFAGHFTLPVSLDPFFLWK
jgi:hypothetical protein